MLIQGKQSSDVTFICDIDSNGSEVYLVGDFNDWDDKAQPMRRARDGSYRSKLRLSPGQYEYKFVIGGVSYSDPDAKHHVATDLGAVISFVIVE